MVTLPSLSPQTSPAFSSLTELPFDGFLEDPTRFFQALVVYPGLPSKIFVLLEYLVPFGKILFI